MTKIVGWGLLGCLLVAGCGRSSAVSTVEGSVTVDDVPVPSGTVAFSPLESNGGQAVSVNIVEGKYHSEEVPRGRLLVHINAFQDTGEKFIEFGIEYPKMENLVPAKYHPGIELTVDAPALTHDFKLTSK